MAAPTMAEIFEKIEALESKVDVAREQKQETTSSNGMGALWGALIGLVIAAALAIGAFFLLRNLKKKNEELAKLRTAAEQDKVRQQTLEQEAAVAVPLDRAAELRIEAAVIEDHIRVQERRIDSTQAMYDSAVERVLQAKNWEELDALNEEGR